jgi:hypothetical protein
MKLTDGLSSAVTEQRGPASQQLLWKGVILVQQIGIEYSTGTRSATTKMTASPGPHIRFFFRNSD